MLRFFILISAILTIMSGCASSTIGPGAGAAQSIVKGSVDDVAKRTQDVFQKMNIQVTGTSTKNAGNERELTGKAGDNNVTVTLDNATSSTTNVEVVAGKNMMSGNKDLANQILNQIISRG